MEEWGVSRVPDQDIEAFLAERGYKRHSFKVTDTCYYKTVPTNMLCLTNEKPPLFLISRSEYDLFNWFQIEIRGGLRSYYDEQNDVMAVTPVRLMYFSLTRDQLFKHLADFEQSLCKAWEAAHDGKSTRYDN